MTDLVNMNTGIEEPFQSQTPKKLVIQAAEKIAFQVVSKCQPVLIQYFFAPDDKVRRKLKVYLKKLKKQYWDDEWCMVDYFRRLVSNSITDVMELHFRKREDLPIVLQNLMNGEHETYDPLILVTFSTQVMFTYEAGYSNAMDMSSLIRVSSNTTKIFNKFLEAVSPFNLEKLSTASIKFEEPLPVVTLIEHSPLLKHIYLIHNNCISNFKMLRQHCKNIESINFKLFPYFKVYPGDGLQRDFLFETFFEGLGMEAVMKTLGSGRQIARSFPNLRDVTINNSRANTSVPVNEFMHCLQHFYPNIRTRWFSFVNSFIGSDELLMSSFQIQSPFLRKECSWDVIEIRYVCDMVILDDRNEDVDEYPRINHIVVHVLGTLNTEVMRFVEGLTRRHQCQSIELIVHKYSLNVNLDVVSSIFDNIGNTLHTLRLHLPARSVINKFIAALNTCSSLQVLSVEANSLEYTNSQNPLKELSNLKSLSVEIISEAYKTKIATQTLIMHLVPAAPYVRTLKLSNVSDETLERIVDLGCLSKLTKFEICSPFPQNLKDCINRLPCLTVLILSYEFYNYTHCWKTCVYYELKEYFQNASLKIFGLDKSSRWPLPQCYELFG